MPDMNSPPFFIVGMPRSGTTLLQSALSAHSALVIPPEEDLILPFYAHFGRDNYRLSDADVERYVSFLFDVEQTICNWKIDRERLLARLIAQDDRSLQNIVQATYGEFLSRFPGKTRWGCKVPYYVRHLDKIDSVFPRAKFLHLIRDPRAVHASMKARRRLGDTYFSESPWRNGWQWNCCVAAGTRCSREFPGRYLEVRYERLVLSPRETLQSICDFLEVPFDAEMLSHYEHTTESKLIRIDNIDRYLKRSFNIESIDAWKDCCTSRDIRIIEELTADMMRELRYAPYLASTSPAESSFIALYRLWRSVGESARSALRQPLSHYRRWSRWSTLSKTALKTNSAASRWRSKRSLPAS